MKRLSGSLAPKTVDTTYRAVTAVLRAAVADRVIASTPAAGVKVPKVVRRKVQPLEVAQVRALADAMPEKRTGRPCCSLRGPGCVRARCWASRSIASISCGVRSRSTFHDLRHHYASVLIAAACSIKAVQEALGHANAGETLNTYSHLWPADDDRVRDAVAAAHDPGRVTAVSRAGGVTP